MKFVKVLKANNENKFTIDLSKWSISDIKISSEVLKSILLKNTKTSKIFKFDDYPTIDIKTYKGIINWNVSVRPSMDGCSIHFKADTSKIIAVIDVEYFPNEEIADTTKETFEVEIPLSEILCRFEETFHNSKFFYPEKLNIEEKNSIYGVLSFH